MGQGEDDRMNKHRKAQLVIIAIVILELVMWILIAFGLFALFSIDNLEGEMRQIYGAMFIVVILWIPFMIVSGMITDSEFMQKVFKDAYREERK